MKKFLIFSICILSGFYAFAQQDNEQREEKIRNYRIAIFTEALKLTSGESEKFWPVYYEFLDKKEALQQSMKPGKTLDLMNDAEVEDQIRKHFEFKQKELDLEKELYQKLRNGILPTRKVAKLPMAEREFRESLLKKIQENRQQRLENRQERQGKRLNRG